MKIVGILGLVSLIFGLLITLIGVGGAVMNFAFPPTKIVCDMAERDYQDVKKAMAEYEAAKGTSEEYAKQAKAKSALDAAEGSQNSCGRMKDTYRFYGLVFSGVGVLGIVLAIVGGIAAYFGLRRRGKMA